MTEKPLLLLDVDGVLNPLVIRKPEGYTKHRALGYDLWLNHGHGLLLTAFAEFHDVELAWATTWEDHANEYIGPHIGLPQLPVIYPFNRKFWKFSGVHSYAKDRPLAWLDDDFDYYPDGQAWFNQVRRGTPTLLHLVSPKVGLTGKDLDAVASWLEKVR